MDSILFSYILACAGVVCSIVVLFYKYRLKSLLHPGIAFNIIWLMSLSFLPVALEVNVIWIESAEYLNELLQFVAFTSAAFALVAIFSRGITFSTTKWNVDLAFQDIFPTLSFFFFIATVLSFTSKGISFSSNLAQQRTMLVEANVAAAYTDERLSLIDWMLNPILMLQILLCIYAGWGISCQIFNPQSTKVKTIYALFPLLSAIFVASISAGRVPITQAAVQYGLGFLLSFFFIPGRKKVVSQKTKKFYLYSTIVLFFAFNIYSTIIKDVRAEYGNSNYTSAYEDKPYLEPFSGVIDYLSYHYIGYQLRRIEMDFETPRKPGEISFNGLTSIKIPLINQLFGFNISAGALLGWEYIDIRKGYSTSELSAASITETAFYRLYQDFGKATMLVLFILIVITQLIFNSLFSRSHHSFLYITMFFLFWTFWFNSWATSYFRNPFSNIFYAAIILDLLIYYKKKSCKKVSK